MAADPVRRQPELDVLVDARRAARGRSRSRPRSRRAAPPRHAAASPAERSGGLTRSDGRVRRRDERRRPVPSAQRSPLRLPRPAPRPGEPLVGEREVVRRHVAGHRQAARPSPGGRGRAAPAVERWVRCSRARGHVADDLGEDREVAGDGGLLGRGRPAPQPEDRRDVAVVRLGAVGQRRILGMVDDRQPERAGVGERVAQERRPSATGAPSSENPTTPASASSPRAASVSPPRPTVIAPQTRAATGEPRRAAAASRTRARTAGSSIGRRRVRHHADRREAAVRGGGETGRDRLGVLVAGLAEVDVEVDEARARRSTPRSSIPSASPPSSQSTASRTPSRHDDLARALAARRGIDQPGPADLEVGDDRRRSRRADAIPAADRAHGRPAAPASRYSSAIRTATPFVTWSVITRPRADGDVRRDLDALVHRARVHDERVGPGERQPLAA